MKIWINGVEAKDEQKLLKEYGSDFMAIIYLEKLLLEKNGEKSSVYFVDGKQVSISIREEE